MYQTIIDHIHRMNRNYVIRTPDGPLRVEFRGVGSRYFKVEGSEDKNHNPVFNLWCVGPEGPVLLDSFLLGQEDAVASCLLRVAGQQG